MTDRQVPDVLLERFLADDLGVDARQRIEAERDARPEVRTRLEELAAERQAFLEADPPAEFARRLAGRLEMEGAAAAVAPAPARPRRWVAWLLGPSVAAAAAAALVVTFTVTRGPDEPTAVLMDAEPHAPAGAAAVAPAEVAPHDAEEQEKPALQPATTPARERPGTLGYGGSPKSRKRKKVKASATKSSAPPKPRPVTTTPPPEPEPMREAADSASTGEAAATATEGGGSGGLPRSGLSQEEILKAVRPEVVDLHACVKPAEDVPAGDYTVVISWTITPRGTVEKPRLESPRSLRKTTLSRCLVREMRTWKFRRAASPTRATLPLEFEVK
jgi:hypothetical protein